MPVDASFQAMVTRSEISPARWRRPLLRWFDGIEAGWAIPLVLIGFVALWLLYRVLAYLCCDLHPDVLETWTLGRTFEWGSYKHPPLMGWVARAWTSVFPLTNWSFELMALTNSAVALWAVDLISRRFVRGDKRMIVLLLLMLPPTYQFYAMRFNANAVLLAIWPIATYCFLRSFETRQAGWAVAAGVAAALAMLGKYYSVFLIGSFVFAAICHRQRRAYFASSAPWISAITGIAALGPHLYWLATTGALPVNYALEKHAGKTIGPALIEALVFLLGMLALLALPTVTWLLILGQRLRRFPDDFRAMSPGLQLLCLIGVGTALFPAIAAIGLGADMPGIWTLQGLFLFVIVMVCGTSYPVERYYCVNLAVFAIGIALAAVVVAPFQALNRNLHPLNEGRNFYRQAALELTDLWHQHSGIGLPAIGGDEALAFAVAFYSPDHPLYERSLVCQQCRLWEKLSAATVERGWAGLCFGGDANCIDTMKSNAARASRTVSSDFVVHSMLLGWPGAAQGFTILIVLPAVEGATAPGGAQVRSNVDLKPGP